MEENEQDDENGENLDNAGGGGGIADSLTQSDLKALQKHIARYPMSAEERSKAVMVCVECMDSRHPRNRLAAVRTLAMLDNLNMEQEKRDLQLPDYHEVKVQRESLIIDEEQTARTFNELELAGVITRKQVSPSGNGNGQK